LRRTDSHADRARIFARRPFDGRATLCASRTRALASKANGPRTSRLTDCGVNIKRSSIPLRLDIEDTSSSDAFVMR
jgi:hypothetical protein